MTNPKVNPSAIVSTELDDLFYQVCKWEGTLAGGTQLGPGGQAIKNFRQTEIRLGNPRDRLIRLTPKLFRDLDIELDEVNKKQMKDQFHFYYLTLTVNLQAVEGVQFSQLSSALDFGPKGKSEPIIVNIFPTSEWKEIFEWGGSLKFGLDAGLNWRAGVDMTPEVQNNIKALSPQTQLKIDNQNHIKSFIEMPDYAFQVGRSEIVASGMGESTCYWEIIKPSIKKQHTMLFGLVFKAPQSISKIELTGEAVAEISYPWLTAQVEHVFNRLSKNWQHILNATNQERKEEERLRLHPAEHWELILPK